MRNTDGKGRVKLTHLSIQPGTSVGYGRDTRGQAVTVYESKTGETISAYASFSRNQLIEIECGRCDRYSYSFYEKILDLQASKQELAEAVLAGDGMNLKELSWEDLKELIG